ncbi:MAG: GAF domain-containing protein, partial [Candidatus Methylomirabilales bacterium]
MFKRRLNLLQQFSLLSFLCILLLSLTLGFVISHLLTQNMLDGEWHDTAEVVQNHIRQRSLHNLFTDPQLGQEPQRYQEALSYLLSLHEVVRVKVWDRAATVRWADDERLIGRRFPENRELQEALGGKVAVKLKELRKAEHAYERERFRKLAEVYVPIFAEQNPEEVIGVLEVYKVPARLFATIHRGKTTVWIISLTGGLLLYLSLFWIFRASSRTQIDLKRSLQEHSDRFEQEVAGRTQDLSLLFQTARQVVSTLNIDEILPTILRSAADLLNCRASSLRLLDRGTNLLRLAADHNLNAEFKQRGHIVLDQGVMGRVALEGQPVTVEDVETDPLYHHKAEALQAGIRSIAIVPLQAEGTIIGVLSVYDRKPRRFSKAEIASLTEFANLAALAIEKARLHEQTLQGKVHLSTILEINKKIGTTTEISDLLHTISDEAARLLRVDGVGFRVVEGDRLVSAAKSGVAHQVMLQPTIQVGESLSGQAAAENHPIIVSDVGAANTWAREHWTAAIREGIQSAMFVPVQIGGRVIGVLNIYAKRNREFTQSDVDLATAFADQAAIAIENARLYDKVRERALKLHGLAELAKFVTSAVEPQRVFDHIAKAASQLLQADLVRLWTTDEAARELTIQASHGSEDLRSTPHIRILIGQGVIGSLWERRRAEFIPDLREDARWLNRNFLESTGLVSFAGVPMVIEGKVLGVLSIFSRELRNFTQLERELIQVLADHAAIALEKARLLQGTIRQNQELATLHTIASTVNQTLHLDALL